MTGRAGVRRRIVLLVAGVVIASCGGGDGEGKDNTTAPSSDVETTTTMPDWSASAITVRLLGEPSNPRLVPDDADTRIHTFEGAVLQVQLTIDGANVCEIDTTTTVKWGQDKGDVEEDEGAALMSIGAGGTRDAGGTDDECTGIYFAPETLDSKEVITEVEAKHKHGSVEEEVEATQEIALAVPDSEARAFVVDVGTHMNESPDEWYGYSRSYYVHSVAPTRHSSSHLPSSIQTNLFLYGIEGPDEGSRTGECSDWVSRALPTRAQQLNDPYFVSKLGAAGGPISPLNTAVLSAISDIPPDVKAGNLYRVWVYAGDHGDCPNSEDPSSSKYQGTLQDVMATGPVVEVNFVGVALDEEDEEGVASFVALLSALADNGIEVRCFSALPSEEETEDWIPTDPEPVDCPGE